MDEKQSVRGRNIYYTNETWLETPSYLEATLGTYDFVLLNLPFFGWEHLFLYLILGRGEGLPLDKKKIAYIF